MDRCSRSTNEASEFVFPLLQSSSSVDSNPINRLLDARISGGFRENPRNLPRVIHTEISGRVGYARIVLVEISIRDEPNGCTGRWRRTIIQPAGGVTSTSDSCNLEFDTAVGTAICLFRLVFSVRVCIYLKNTAIRYWIMVFFCDKCHGFVQLRLEDRYGAPASFDWRRIEK